MFEFHGWINVKELPSDVDLGNLGLIADELREVIATYIWTSGVLDIVSVNGQYHVLISGFTNHRDRRAMQVLEFLETVALRAPGSYGILYYRDDEDADPISRNTFQVLTVARGSVQPETDCYLSPFVPRVEDS